MLIEVKRTCGASQETTFGGYFQKNTSKINKLRYFI